MIAGALPQRSRCGQCQRKLFPPSFHGTEGYDLPREKRLVSGHANVPVQHRHTRQVIDAVREAGPAIRRASSRRPRPGASRASDTTGIGVPAGRERLSAHNRANMGRESVHLAQGMLGAGAAYRRPTVLGGSDLGSRDISRRDTSASDHRQSSPSGRAARGTGRRGPAGRWHRVRVALRAKAGLRPVALGASGPAAGSAGVRVACGGCGGVETAETAETGASAPVTTPRLTRA